MHCRIARNADPNAGRVHEVWSPAVQWRNDDRPARPILNAAFTEV